MNSKDVPEAQPLNDTVMIGIMADGLEVTVGTDYTVIDAGIWRPRSPEPVIVSRVMVPTSSIGPFIDGLQEAWEAYQDGELSSEIFQETKIMDENE